MSDTLNAPPPPTTSSPSPQTEVPVNPSPVSTPSPLGEQAPPKPDGQETNKSSHIGRREAIEKAFARSKEAQDEAAKTTPKRAKPGMGHNQPPEAMEAEKKPSAQSQQHREAGRFARDPNKIDQEQQSSAQAPPGQIQPLEPNARYREPLPRFSEQAKQEWHATPESVRGAVHNMAREFHGAYEKYRGDYEVMETLRPYHNLAQQQGTSLEKAFNNYYQMEQKLRTDMIGGLDVIVQNMRMQHDDGSPVTLRDVAHHIVTMSPEQHRMTAQQNQQTAADMRIGQLHQMVEKLTNGFEKIQYRERFNHHRSEVDKFAETHPRLDELGAAIKQELDLGFSLPVAYARADRLYPSTQAAQTRTQSAQTRRTSISGAPDGKSVNTRPSDGRRNANGEDKHPTRREAIAKAMRRVGNGI